jgi:hypothetical protein
MLDRIVEAAVRDRLPVLLALIALVGAATLLLPRLNLFVQQLDMMRSALMKDTDKVFAKCLVPSATILGVSRSRIVPATVREGFLRWLPAACRVAVHGSGIHPALAAFGDLLLPKRCPSLQVVDQELAGAKGISPMGAGNGYQHNRILGLELSYAVEYSDVLQVPAPSGLLGDRSQGFLRHPRVVLQDHARYPLAFVDVPHQADKGHQSPDLRSPWVEILLLRGEIQRLGLDAYVDHSIVSRRAPVCSPAARAASLSRPAGTPNQDDTSSTCGSPARPRGRLRRRLESRNPNSLGGRWSFPETVFL